MNENFSWLSAAALIVKRPSTPVVAPVVVPTTTTVAPMSGSPALSVTLPLT